MSQSYAAKKTMFASLAKGGHLQISELVDYPGITLSDCKKDRNAQWTRTISFDGEEFETIGAAIEAWLKKPDSNTESDKCPKCGKPPPNYDVKDYCHCTRITASQHESGGEK